MTTVTLSRTELSGALAVATRNLVEARLVLRETATADADQEMVDSAAERAKTCAGRVAYLSDAMRSA